MSQPFVGGRICKKMSLSKICMLLLLVIVPSFLEDWMVRISALFVCAGISISLVRKWLQHDAEVLRKAISFHDGYKSGMARVRTGARILPVLANQLKEVENDTERAVLTIGRKFTAIVGRARRQATHAEDVVNSFVRLSEALHAADAHSGPGAVRRIDYASADAKRRLQDLGRESTALAQDISGIVVNMQFQDITSQRIEHVIGPLLTLHGQIEGVVRELSGQDEPTAGQDEREARFLLDKTYTMEAEHEVMRNTAAVQAPDNGR